MDTRATNMECWLGGFVIFQGIPTSIAKEPYIFVIFQGGGVRKRKWCHYQRVL